MHIEEGLLQAYLDNEVSSGERELIEKHLLKCEECRVKLEELKNMDDFFLASLENQNIEIEQAEVDNALKNINLKIKKSKWKGWGRKVASYKKLVAGVAATFVFGTILFVPSVREAAADALHIFRAKQVESVEVNFDDLQRIERQISSKVGEVDLEELGKVTIHEQSERQSGRVTEIKEMVNFPIKVPKDFDENKKLNVNTALDIDFALDVDHFNKIVKDLGGNKFLPEDLKGNKFNISSAGTIHLSYDLGEDGVYLSQIATPKISVPDGINVDDLKDILMNLPILPNDIKNQLENIRDLQQTLVIPTDKDSSEVVKIRNSKAILQKHNDWQNLTWIENGILYYLSGSEKIDLVEIAKGLRDIK